MKGLSAKDLRGNDPVELRSTARKLEEDLFKHRLKQNTNQLENTMLLRNTRRDIARVNTVLAERLRALGGGAAPAKAPAAATDESVAAPDAAKPTKAKAAKADAETKQSKPQKQSSKPQKQSPKPQKKES
jgi:large subunit ribosomal protein L29